MKTINWRIFAGLAVMAVGVLALLQSLGLLAFTSGSLWLAIFAVIFGLTGLGFVYVYFSEPAAWWAAIPGFTLTGLGVLMGLEMIPAIPDLIPPVVFMGSISASFWMILFRQRTFWWAIIPGGVLFTMTLIILIGDFEWLIAPLLFLGLAATFGLVALYGNEQGKRQSWAWIPAAVLAGMALLVLALSGGPIPDLVWALVLIGVGGFLVIRTLILQKK